MKTGAKPTDEAQPLNSITINIYEDYFMFKAETPVPADELIDIFVGCLQHIENMLDGTVDSSSSTMLQ